MKTAYSRVAGFCMACGEAFFDEHNCTVSVTALRRQLFQRDQRIADTVAWQAREQRNAAVTAAAQANPYIVAIGAKR